MDNLKSITLDTIGNGTAIERFNNALQDVITNISDPMTSAEKPREIILSVKLIPEKSRKNAVYTIDVKTKLQPPKEKEGILFLNLKNLEAYENDPEQEELSFGNVSDIHEIKTK